MLGSNQRLARAGVSSGDFRLKSKRSLFQVFVSFIAIVAALEASIHNACYFGSRDLGIKMKVGNELICPHSNVRGAENIPH